MACLLSQTRAYLKQSAVGDVAYAHAVRCGLTTSGVQLCDVVAFIQRLSCTPQYRYKGESLERILSHHSALGVSLAHDMVHMGEDICALLLKTHVVRPSTVLNNEGDTIFDICTRKYGNGVVRDLLQFVLADIELSWSFDDVNAILDVVQPSDLKHLCECVKGTAEDAAAAIMKMRYITISHFVETLITPSIDR